MSGRFPKPQPSGKAIPSKESSKKPEKPSAARKPSMERGHSSRSGASSLPSSPLNPKPSPAVSKKTSPMPGKKEALLKLKGMKTEAEKTSEKKIVEEQTDGEPQGAVGGVAAGQEHRSRSPVASNKTNKVETGTFERRSPAKCQPVSTKPVLSPRSKKVQESAKKFLNLKKTENNEQRGMETYIVEQFPKLRRKLEFVEALSNKVTKLPLSTPDSEELIRQENESLNRLISQSAGVFRDFESMLIETRERVVAFMQRAEEATKKLDDSLRDVVNDICNYSNLEVDVPPVDQPGDDQGGKPGDDGKGGPSGDQGGDKPGDQGSGKPTDALGDQDGDKPRDVPGNEGSDDGPDGSAKEEKPVDGCEYHIQKSTAPFPGINPIDSADYSSPPGSEAEYESESEYEGFDDGKYPRFQRVDNFFKESMRGVCELLGGFKDTVADVKTLNSEDSCRKLLDVFRTVVTVAHGLKDILELLNDVGERRSFGQFVDLMKDNGLPDKDSMEMKTVTMVGDMIVKVLDMMRSPDYPVGHGRSSLEGIRHVENVVSQFVEGGAVAAIVNDFQLD